MLWHIIKEYIKVIQRVNYERKSKIFAKYHYDYILIGNKNSLSRDYYLKYFILR